MKWPHSRRTENEGLLYVQGVVNEHGSIFRRTHQEEDIGIDGTVEIVNNEEPQGLLIAIQVKSGHAYERPDKMVVSTDRRHLDYWRSFMLPVVVIAYSPTRRTAFWTRAPHEYQQTASSASSSHASIEVPFLRTFDRVAMDRDLPSIARTYRDRSRLFHAADSIVSDDADRRHQGMFLLTQHPDSEMSRLTVLFASELLLDSDPRIVRLAVELLGRSLDQNRWDHLYGKQNIDVELFAQRICFRFERSHIRSILAAIHDGRFGRASLGEAALYCLSRSPQSEQICREIVLDTAEDMYVRANALAAFYAGDWDELLADSANLVASGLSPIVDWLNSNLLSTDANTDESGNSK